jgi:hypothetical protein
MLVSIVVLLVKDMLVPLNSKAPTEAEEQAFLEFEDTHGNYGMYPSPAERHADALDWKREMLEFSLWTLLRWRLAVAWMPFCRGEQRLVGERLSRWLMPNLWEIRRQRRLAERAAKERRTSNA